MYKITEEQDIHVELHLLIEAPIFHTGTQIQKISHQNGIARIYHQILFVDLMIEKCLKRNLW